MRCVMRCPVVPRGLGTFTRLCRNGAVWMSDTVAEQRDHGEIRYQMSAWDRCERPWSLLIHGLGIGMILHWALQSKHCERIDVVELDADVITLIGAHYDQMAADAGIALTIHHGDCNTQSSGPPVPGGLWRSQTQIRSAIWNG